MSNEQLIRGLSGSTGYEPSKEKSTNERSLPGFLESNPTDDLVNGTFPEIPLLLGVTRDETINGIDLKNIQSIFNSSSVFLESIARSIKDIDIINSLPNVELPGIGKGNKTKYFVALYF